MSCPTGKRVFESWPKAERVAREQRRRGSVVGPYRCPYGPHFHTGSNSDQDGRNRRRILRRLEESEAW